VVVVMAAAITQEEEGGVVVEEGQVDLEVEALEVRIIIITEEEEEEVGDGDGEEDHFGVGHRVLQGKGCAFYVQYFGVAVPLHLPLQLLSTRSTHTMQCQQREEKEVAEPFPRHQ